MRKAEHIEVPPPEPGAPVRYIFTEFGFGVRVIDAVLGIAYLWGTLGDFSAALTRGTRKWRPAEWKRSCPPEVREIFNRYA
jgi:hypothetical protein